MQTGSRQFTIQTPKNKVRFSLNVLSLEKEAAYIHLTIEMLEGTGTITLHSKLMAMFKMKTAIMKNILGRKSY